MNVKKFFLILLLILLAALAAFGGVALAWIHSHPFDTGDHGDALAKVASNGIVNFMLVGKDHVGENTDVIMVASLNPATDKVSILSVPRDTRVNLNGNRKINSVYSYAGVRGMKKEETLINTVTQVTGLPIHYFAMVNLRAFREVVDELGGVEFNVTRSYNYDDDLQGLHIHLQPGLQKLNVEQAEGLIRYRHDYAMGDIQRVGVQQEFIMEMIRQKLQLQYISKIPAVYNSIEDDIISNLKISDIINYAKAFVGCEVETFLLPGSTGSGSGYWIQNVDETRALVEEKFGYTDEN